MSESEISAQLKLEVSVGEVFELEFELPSAPVAIRAVVRCKTAFRPVEENWLGKLGLLQRFPSFLAALDFC